MTINRNNISTSADGADIFVIAQPAARFTNFGNLATSGDLARAIHVAADGVTVDNQGAVTTSGSGSSAIIVGDPYGARYNNVAVVNHGTITTTGGTLDSDSGPIFSAGIDLFGDNNRGVNYGTITNLDGDDAGMNSVGSFSTLLNFGHIDSQIIGMVIDGDTGTETGSTMINYGQIHTAWDGSYGMAVLVGGNVAKNYGTIRVDGVFSFGMALNADGNHGENYGTVLATGDQSRGVILEGQDLTFANHGTIQTSGADSIGVRFSGEDLPGTDGGTFTNYGKIVSAAWAVKGAFADDHFVNHGSLIGDVYMGAGDDSYVAGKGGSLSGALTLGDGDDLIVFEKGGGKLVVTDFAAGAGTDDVIDVSAFGFATFDQIMAKASQSGSDVILKLGAKDQIVLEKVSIDSLSSDDFTFASAALQQAMAPAHVPHADYLIG
jgi:hypothetical protein